MKKQRLRKILSLIGGLLAVQLACLGSVPPATSIPEPSLTPVPRRTTAVPPAGPTLTTSPTLRPSSTPLATSTRVPSLTPIPSKTFTPAVIGLGFSELPFRDDFSSEQSGWPEEAGEDWGYGYLNDNYQMYNNIPFAEVCSSRQRSHVDATIKVRVTKISGPNDAYFGVTCRKTGANYYALTINGNGEYGIYKTIGGLSDQLIGGFHGAIKRGNATNDLEATCNGSILTLRVNGIEVVEVLDPGFQFGTFLGLIVGTKAGSEIEVVFDNFDAFEP